MARPGRLLAACLLLLAASALGEDAPPGADVLVAAAAAPGGTVADRYPFVALVASKDAPLCVGSLVAPRAVLTAASCTVGYQKPELVYVGMFNTFLDEFRRPHAFEMRWVERVERHPDFSQADPRQNNLALLVLRQPSRHPPATLAPATFAYPLNSTAATAAGFGSLSADGHWPQLHADPLTLLPEEECSGLQTAYGPKPQTQAQACTGLSHSFRACAAGNVGAPLLLPGGNGSQPLQVALLTSGFACSTDPQVASPSSPALYAWLPRYADWLRRELESIGRSGGKRGGDKA